MNPFIIAVLAAWLNPAVTQDNIAGTICRHGWTATVRPPLAYTEKLKRAQMRSLGIKVSMRLYEEEHFIPLELGGNPVSVANLWLQAWHGACSAAIKDIDERVLN